MRSSATVRWRTGSSPGRTRRSTGCSRKDFAGTLLRFVERVAAAPAIEHPGVAFDFWDQYAQQDRLEELTIERPAAFQALPKAPPRPEEPVRAGPGPTGRPVEG